MTSSCTCLQQAANPRHIPPSVKFHPPMSAHRSAPRSSSRTGDQGTGHNGEENGTARFSDAPNETVVLPFHGSCSKCHHLHTNKPLRLSLNFLHHVRLRCDRCDHQMFGFGRTSTQTTLASVESISSLQRSNRNSSILRPSPQSVCISPPAEQEETAHQAGPDNLASQPPLSTINESLTPAGRSRSSSKLQSPDDVSVRPEGTTVGSSAGGQENSIEQHPLSSEPTEVPQPVQAGRHPFAKLKNAWNRAVDNKSHGRRGKKWKLPRIIKIGSIFARRSNQERVTPASSPPPQMEGVDHPGVVDRGSDPSDEVASGSADTRIPSRAPTRDLASSHREVSPDPSEGPTRDTDHPTRASGSTTRDSREFDAGVDASQPGATDEISSPSTSADQQMTQQRAEEIKRDRVHAWRRDKTIRSEMAARPECHCHRGCHCYGVNQASGSDITSETHRSLNSNFEAPDHSLQHLWISAPAPAPEMEHHVASATASVGHLPPTLIGSTQLSGIGRHFDSRAVPRTLTQAYRLSQATTIHNGSTSSISLTPYPGQPVGRRPGPSIRPRSLEGVRRQEFHTSSTRSDPDSDMDDFRHSSEETITDGSSIHTGITAPVNLSDAQDGQHPPVQGRSASLSIQTANIVTVNGSPASDSQTATPRPSGDNELSEGLTTSPQPEPAVISSALRDLNPTG